MDPQFIVHPTPAITAETHDTYSTLSQALLAIPTERVVPEEKKALMGAGDARVVQDGVYKIKNVSFHLKPEKLPLDFLRALKFKIMERAKTDDRIIPYFDDLAQALRFGRPPWKTMVYNTQVCICAMKTKIYNLKFPNIEASVDAKLEMLLNDVVENCFAVYTHEFTYGKEGARDNY